MFKRSGKRSHPFLLTSSFSPVPIIPIISVVGFCQNFFNSSKFPDISNLLRVFFLSMNCCWVFSNAFYAPIDMIVWFFFLSVDVMDYSSQFLILNHPYINGINSTLLWCIILCIHCWIWFANILLRIVTSIFMRDTDLQFSFLVMSLILLLG